MRLCHVILFLLLGLHPGSASPQLPSTKTPPVKPVAGQPWTNSLGIKFVPAGTDKVLFCVWDVRVKDYAPFVKETGWPVPPKPDFPQTENDPVVMVNWNDAHHFCDWLTKKEQAAGWLASNQMYRLPTDAEWSKAAGLENEGPGTPRDKDGRIKGVYPWGTQWPPPKGAGNYCGEEIKSRDPSWSGIAGYNDGYVQTSPVGSFLANRYGLYDMGGNVWQWCEDQYNVPEHPTQEFHVVRGASWSDDNPDSILLSFRGVGGPDYLNDDYGFRCVVALSP